MTVNKQEELALSKIAEATGNIDFLIWDIQAVSGALNALLCDLEDGIKDLKAYGLSGGGLPGQDDIVDRAWVISRYCRDVVKKLDYNQQIVSDGIAALAVKSAQCDDKKVLTAKRRQRQND